MGIARSKVTAQGQISVPAEVRRRLGLRPGSVIEWEEAGDAMVVRKVGRWSSEDIHQRLFPEGAPASRDLPGVKDGIERHVRTKHGRR
jgi:AbrB family looped-hinge helix DNA binding protein